MALAERLAALPKLQYLGLSQTSAGPGEVLELKLPVAQSVEISDIFVPVRVIAPNLRSIAAPLTLDLFCNLVQSTPQLEQVRFYQEKPDDILADEGLLLAAIAALDAGSSRHLVHCGIHVAVPSSLILALARNCPLLGSLSISLYPVSHLPQQLRTIVSLLPELQELDLSYADTVDLLPAAASKLISEDCKIAPHGTLTQISSFYLPTWMNVAGLEFPALRALTMYAEIHGNDSVHLQFLRRCPALETIEIEQKDDIGLMHVAAASLPRLSRLQYRMVTPSSRLQHNIAEVIAASPTLTTLSVRPALAEHMKTELRAQFAVRVARGLTID